MISFPVELREPTEDDVLRIDPVTEYDRRKILRDLADKQLAETGDGTDQLLTRGRPTGP